MPDASGNPGPYLLVAVPDEWIEAVPVNATAIIREWQCCIDPMRSLRAVAERRSAEHGNARLVTEWVISDRFVIPDFETIRLVRQAVRDDTVIAAFAGSSSVLREGSGGGMTLATIAAEILDSRAYSLPDRAVPVILGMAVVASVESGIGWAGREVSKEWAKARPAVTDEQDAAGDLPAHSDTTAASAQ